MTVQHFLVVAMMIAVDLYNVSKMVVGHCMELLAGGPNFAVV